MRLRWAPALVLVIGVVLIMGADRQRALPLVRPLAEAIPMVIQGYLGGEIAVSDAEAQAAGFSNYLMRVYERAEADTLLLEVNDIPPPWFSLYVGFYESQAQGTTIHSPKNCLPGAGWEALSSESLAIELEGRTVWVNRYVLRNDLQQALALYWYQGRGRVAHDEYRVKLNLLLDSALRRRSDEALVRIVVPLDEMGEDAATQFATRAAQVVVPSLELALPGG